MKKVLAMVLVAVMTLLAIPSLAEPKLGCWTLQYYVDEFDDPTDKCGSSVRCHSDDETSCDSFDCDFDL